MKNHTEVFRELAVEAIEDLKKLPQPVVRVFGPLTTGGFGYEENAKRFLRSEAVLRAKGYTVFDYSKYEKTISKIYEPSLHTDVMEYFHKPIIEADIIKEVFFLPKWEESKGATYERNLCEKLGITISEFPEAWFEEGGAQ